MKDTTDRPVHQIFTTRAGGVSAEPYGSFNLADHVGDDPAAVAANRDRLATVLGLAPDHIIWMEQLHSNTVTVVDAPRTMPVPATDALVTTTPGLALAVLTADCVPLLLADTDQGVIAAVHAGRLGARNGIVRKTVEKMVELGATPVNIHALLGPAAGGEDYEVPRAMMEDVENHLPGSASQTRKGTPSLDLRAGIVHQLLGMGVQRIDADPRSTIEDKDFYSHRRDGVTGRQAAVIWLS